jgi:hypothetical protein
LLKNNKSKWNGSAYWPILRNCFGNYRRTQNLSSFLELKKSLTLENQAFKISNVLLQQISSYINIMMLWAYCVCISPLKILGQQIVQLSFVVEVFIWWVHLVLLNIGKCRKSILYIHISPLQLRMSYIKILDWRGWRRYTKNTKSTFEFVYNEPRHDKTNIMGLRPAWIQNSLRIRAVWSGPCCALTNPITSRETDSEQHGSWSDCAEAQTGLDPC